MLEEMTAPKFNYQPQSLEGKAVVVTGGTTGIGRATALRLAADGARILIFGRHERELKDALEDIESAGEVHGLTADQARHEDVRRVFKEADQKLGGVDILINNAAIGAGTVLESEYSHWLYVIQTNLIGYIDCARQAVDRMRKKGAGHIINVGSLSAEEREAGEDVYTATKSAVRGFTESLRKSVNKTGIKVSLIEPGSVGTDMSDEPVEEQRRQQDAMEMLKAEDIAECVHYCLVQPERCDLIAVQIRPHLQTT